MCGGRDVHRADEPYVNLARWAKRGEQSAVANTTIHMQQLSEPYATIERGEQSAVANPTSTTSMRQVIVSQIVFTRQVIVSEPQICFDRKSDVRFQEELPYGVRLAPAHTRMHSRVVLQLLCIGYAGSLL